MGKSINGGIMVGSWWTPVMESARVGGPMSEAVGNAEPSAALQLGQYNDHLPGGYTLYSYLSCSQINNCSSSIYVSKGVYNH